MPKGPKTKVLYIANQSDMEGGIGTILANTVPIVASAECFDADTLLTSYDEVNKWPLPSMLFRHLPDSKPADCYSHVQLPTLLARYDIVHVHGLPHYGLLESLEKLKAENPQALIVTTINSSVKKEFLAYYEHAMTSLDPEIQQDFEILDQMHRNGLLRDPSRFADTYWGSAIWRQEKIMTMSDSVQHMSKAYRDAIIEEYSAQENQHKHTIVPVGITRVKRTKRHPNKKRLLFVGRFAKEKGIDEFIEAIPLILERHPDAEIKLAGGDKKGLLVDKYKKKLYGILKNGQSERVSFTGWIPPDEVSRAYAWTDYVVIPSRTENCCLVASEALMHERVPVVTRTASMNELFISRGIALGIDEDQRDGPGIADTLGQIITGGKGHSALIRRGRKFVMENYSAEKAALAQMDAYKELISCRQAE